jgi:LacI family transcriptional regulator
MIALLRKKYSIHDIAKELNVSATTISFVLNGGTQGKKVSEPVRKKILDFVEAIGYKPNLVAQSLRTGKSRIIGMLVEDISDPFFSGIARIIEMKAAKLGYKMFLSSTENDTGQTQHLLRLMRDRQVDGYIMAPPPGIEKEVQELINDNIALVLFDRYFPGIDSHIIEVDNFGGVYKATQHFISNSYKHIVFITLESSQTQMTGRLNGYNQAIAEAALTPLVFKMPYGLDEATMEDRITDFLSWHPAIDAVFFATNYLAKVGIKAIRDSNLTIPYDIAVMSFDDNVHFPMYSPTVTAVAQPLQDISDKCISKLINLLSGKDTSKKSHTVLDVTLMIRDSSLRKSVSGLPGFI